MLWLVTAILLVPVLPFLVFGSSLDEWVERWQRQPASGGVTAVLVVAVLATDILLPIPSSVVSTAGGVRLGWLGGTLASCLGMTAGAVLGFAIARRWGRSVAAWFTREEDLERMKAANDRLGELVLVLARGVPVLAEASVLLAGIHRLTWRRFLPPIVMSNLGISLAYSAFGDFAGRHQWLPTALAVAIALPVVLAVTMHRLLRGSSG
jgi:uncharacterized membrane protein YdjX (TVP38/TMEM64 family)